jgi:hypothetical protein
MNLYLLDFINRKFDKPGTALDLGAGQFFDVACLRQLGWECDGVDLSMGIDLEHEYVAGQYDLVYSNYVIQKLKNKQVLVSSSYKNLAKGGWFFLHTFDVSDKNAHGLKQKQVVQMLENYFINVSLKVFSFYDNEHHHWHRIIEATGQKAN